MAAKKTDAVKAKGVEEKEVKKTSKTTVYALVAIGAVVVIIGLFLILSQPGGKPLVTNTTNETAMNAFQYCAGKFNEQGIIGPLVQQFYNGTGARTYIMTMPKVIDCNNVNYTYSFEIGDGYAKTIINGYFAKSNFKTGIVTAGIIVPEDVVAQSVYVYITRTAPGKLTYNYQIKSESIVRFDAYGVPLVKKYGIKDVPTLVWNCKFASVGTKVPEELNGTIQKGTEKKVLATLACIFNDGVPESICSQLGVNLTANNSISAQIPQDYIVSMYHIVNGTSCKPDNTTLGLDAFYTIDCPDCDTQRQVLNELAQTFGRYLNLTYYCLGPQDQCENLIRGAKA